MTLVEATPSGEMRVILCLKFDRRAPFDAVATFKQRLIDCDCVVHSVDASGSFDYIVEAALHDFAAYHALLDTFADELARLVERQEASFVCRRFVRVVHRDYAIWVPCRDGRRRVECTTIELIRAEGDYVRLHCGVHSWLLHDTMHHLREVLDAAAFLTIHRSTIVNVGFIERLLHRRHYWVALLGDGSEHRIAKSHVVEVLTALRTDSSIADDTSAARRRSGESSVPPMEQPVHLHSITAN